jgi:hypothetical protein
MQAVRQEQMMVSKENIKLVSIQKDVSILCPLITSILLYVVKALHSHCTRGEGPCFNKFNHFHCSVQNVFQAVRHSLGSKNLCSVPKWRREQLLALALPLHYVSLSWLLHHQYRYQHEQQLHTDR